MRGLLIKDLRLFLQQKKFLIMLLVIAVLLNGNSNATFVISYLTFLCSFVSLSTISYDEFDNGYAFLFTLPVGRRTYATEKYVFSIILGVIAWLIGVLTSIPFQMYQNADFVLKEGLIEAVILLPCLFVMLSVMIPFLLKFGGEKGRTAMLVVVGIAFVVGFALVKLVEILHIDVNKILSSLPVMNMGTIVVAAFVASFVVLLVSVVVSVRIMEKKEF